MTDQITLTGLVATDPRTVTTSEGLAIASFRLASTQRRFDRGQNRWVDGETNWYTITTFRQLAHNVSQSVNKGERIIVTGRLRIRDWVAGVKTGTNIEVDADALGHDLTWGTSNYHRTISTTNVATIAAGAEVAGLTTGDAANHAPGDAAGVSPATVDGSPEVDEANGEAAGWALPLAGPQKPSEFASAPKPGPAADREPAFAELPASDGVPF